MPFMSKKGKNLAQMMTNGGISFLTPKKSFCVLQKTSCYNSDLLLNFSGLL